MSHLIFMSAERETIGGHSNALIIFLSLEISWYGNAACMSATKKEKLVLSYILIPLGNKQVILNILSTYSVPIHLPLSFIIHLSSLHECLFTLF